MRYIKPALVDLSYGLLFFMILRVNWGQDTEFSYLRALGMTALVIAVYTAIDIFRKIQLDKKLLKLERKNDSKEMLKARRKFDCITFAIIFLGLTPAYAGVKAMLGVKGMFDTTLLIFIVIGLAISIAGTFLYYSWMRKKEA